MSERRSTTADRARTKRLLAHARQLTLAKRHDLAEPVLRRVLADEPGNSAAHRQLAGCLLSLRRIDEACDEARAAVSLDPSSTAALATLASLHMVQGRHAEAVATYERALQVKPDYWPAVFGLAGAMKVHGSWPDALVWADRGLAMRPEHVGLLCIRGQALAVTGDAAAALAAMERFLQLAPDEAQSHRAAAVILRLVGRTAEATTHAHRAMQINPFDPDAHLHLAMLKLKGRDFDDADEHYKAAALIDAGSRHGQRGPAGIELRSLLGQAAVSLNKRRFRLAEEHYRRIIEIDPTHDVAAALLAGSIGAQYRFDEALQLARSVVERAPTLEVPRRILAALLCATERHGEAIALASETLERFPDSADLLWLHAVIHVNLDDYHAAFAFADGAVRVKSTLPIRRTLAVTLAGLGRTAEATDAIEGCLREESGTFSAEEAAGYAYYLLGDLTRAEGHLRRAMAADESGLGGHGWLGLIYVAMGRRTDARPLLETAVRLNPHHRHARTALAALSRPQPNA